MKCECEICSLINKLRLPQSEHDLGPNCFLGMATRFLGASIGSVDSVNDDVTIGDAVGAKVVRTGERDRLGRALPAPASN